MNIVSWLVVGALVGWVANILTGNGAKNGGVSNIFVGIIGGLIGGYMMNLSGGYGINGFNLTSVFIAALGAFFLLLIVNTFR